MKAFISSVLALALLASPAALALHRGGSRGENHGSHSSGGSRPSRGNDGHFDRSRHGRVDRAYRIVGGRRAYFFDGFWFGCDVWPEWVLEGDVYVLVVNGDYVMYSYSNPSLFISVNIVP